MAAIGAMLDGKYQLVRKLGEGGMGAVYEARNVQIGKRLAVKILLPQYATDQKLVKLFQSEARAAAAVGHPGIIDVYDLGWAADGSPYIVMEYLEGESLNQLLEERERLSVDMAAYVVCQTLSALSAVHERGIVHRDLKPDNIFLVDLGRTYPEIKLLDFGISKFIESSGSETKFTKTGTILGTPQYMSPEHARGVEDLDLRVDLYAMGSILFECVTGQPPFTGRNYNEILTKILIDPTPRPSLVWPHVPPSFEAIILKAMSKDRELRISSADALMLELLPFVNDAAKTQIALPTKLRGRGPIVPPSGTLRGPPVKLPAGDPSAAPSEEEAGDTELYLPPVKREPRRRTWLVARVVVAVVIAAGALVGVGINGLSQRDEAPRDPEALRAAQQLIGTTTIALDAEAAPAPPGPNEPTNQPSLSVAEPPQPSDAAQPEPVRLTINVVEPRVGEVSVLLDERRLEGPPYSVIFPRDGRRHTLVVIASGYHRWSEELFLDGDRVIEVRLPRRGGSNRPWSRTRPEGPNPPAPFPTREGGAGPALSNVSLRIQSENGEVDQTFRASAPLPVSGRGDRGVRSLWPGS